MGTTPEGIIKRQICDYLSFRCQTVCKFWINSSTGIYDPKIGKFRRNNSRYQIKGVADILGILKGGRLLAIEVKAAKSYMTPEQKTFIADINSNGGLAFMARSVDDVITEFKKAGL